MISVLFSSMSSTWIWSIFWHCSEATACKTEICTSEIALEKAGIFPDQKSSTAAIIWVHEKDNLSYKSFLFLLRFKILLRLSTPKSSSSPSTSSPHGESLFCLHSNMKPTNHGLTSVRGPDVSLSFRHSFFNAPKRTF